MVWLRSGPGREDKYPVATEPAASSSSLFVPTSWLLLVFALLLRRTGFGWAGEGEVVGCVAVASTSPRRVVAAVYAGCGAAVVAAIVLPRSLRIKRGVGLLVSPTSSWASVLSEGAGIVSSLGLGGVGSGSSSDSRPESVSISVSSPPCTSPSSSSSCSASSPSTCSLLCPPLPLPDASCATGTPCNPASATKRERRA